MNNQVRDLRKIRHWNWCDTYRGYKKRKFMRVCKKMERRMVRREIADWEV